MTAPKTAKRATIVFALVVGLGPLVALYLTFGSSSARRGLGPAAGVPTAPPSPGWHLDVHPHPTYPPPYLNDCATTDFSALSPPVGTGEIDTLYDPETRVYTVQAYLAGGTGEGSVTFYVSVDDPACQKVHFLDERIDTELADYVDQLVGDCAGARDALTGAGPPVPNPEGAQDFIDSWCGAIPPPSPSVGPASPSGS